MTTAKRNGLKMRTYEREGLRWVDITQPSARAVGAIREKFPFFLDIDLRDCLPPNQRPKLLEREQYIFIILHFPYFDEKTRAIKATEVDLFIGKDFVVSNHEGVLRPLVDLAECFEGLKPLCTIEDMNNPAVWLHAVLNSLLAGCFPMLTHMANDINALEAELFRETDAGTIKEILRVKSNIVDMRKIMQGHKHIIEKFLASAHRIVSMKDLAVYYEDLIEHTKEIWDFLDNDRSTIDALYDSYLSLVTFETSQSTKALSALALIIFPMNLVAAIFAMRADHMPFLGWPGDFWFMLGTVFFVMTVTVGYLRMKKWL